MSCGYRSLFVRFTVNASLRLLSFHKTAETGGKKMLELRPVRYVPPFVNTVFFIFLYGALAIYFCWPILVTGENLGILDWDQHLLYHGVVIKSLIDYGQLPFWNPWYCGGNILWSNPQVPLLSPAYLMAVFLPLSVAMKLNITFHYFIGLLGMHYFLRRGIGIRSNFSVIFGACIFVFSGGIALHISVGHSTFLPCLYFPFLLGGIAVFHRRGDLRGLLVSSFAAAAVVYNGGFNPIVVFSPLLFSLLLVVAIRSRSTNPLVGAAIVVCLAFMLSAPKLLPVMDFFLSEDVVDHRGTGVDNADYLPFQIFKNIYIEKDQKRDLIVHSGQKYGWHEYGNYLGFIGPFLFLAACALVLFAKKWREPWFVAAVLGGCLLLALQKGYWSGSPYAFLKQLPIFEGMRVPSRFSLAVAFCVAIVAAILFGNVHRAQSERKYFAVGLNFLLCLFTAEIVVANSHLLQGTFPIEFRQQKFPHLASFQYDFERSPFERDSPMYTSMLSNKSMVHCYEPLSVKRKVIAGTAFVSTEPEARILSSLVLQNRIEVQLAAQKPVLLSLNHNFARGWSLVVNQEKKVPLKSFSKISLPEGRVSAKFEYTPPLLREGVLLASLGVLIFLWLYCRSLKFH